MHSARASAFEALTSTSGPTSPQFRQTTPLPQRFVRLARDVRPAEMTLRFLLAVTLAAVIHAVISSNKSPWSVSETMPIDSRFLTAWR